MKNFDNDIFEEVSRDVTGKSGKRIYNAEEAKEIIARICHIKGRISEKPVEETEQDRREDEVLKEFGF